MFPYIIMEKEKKRKEKERLYFITDKYKITNLKE